jgi:RyR domain
MTYTPAPIDTSHVRLSPEILQLTERLAKNAHEVWAQERMAQGWRFGPERNDRRKEHPSLVPYEQLPESEKVYDRNTAMGTLKAILVLGYRIVEPVKP